MGKSSRSRRSTKREVQVLDFSNWINENLASFDHRDYENDSSVDLLLRVARHWMKPECKNFFYFADKLCRGSKRSTFRMTYSNVLLENVLDAMDNGNVTMGEFHIMIRYTLMHVFISSTSSCSQSLAHVLWTINAAGDELVNRHYTCC